MTNSITLESQVSNLQLDLKTSIESFFESLPEINSLVAMSEALVNQSKSISVFRRDQSGKIVVNDSDAYVKAIDQTKALKSVEEQFSELIDPYVDKAYKLHKTLTGIRKTYLDAGQSEQKRLKLEREQFAAEQERMRQEATQKAQKEAYEREQARLMEEARQVAATGDSVTADAIIEEAINVEVATVVLPSTVPDIPNSHFVTKYEWELIDRRKLKDEFLKVDELGIGKVVRSMRKAAETIVGESGAIRVFERKIPVDR